MPATNNLILEKSLGTIYLSLCIWKIFGGESGFWNNNWNHPLKDKHLFHLFLNKRNRDLFLRRAPGGSFFETFHKRCRRRRRRCSVQVSFSWLPPDHNVRQYPIEQSLFFSSPPFGAVYIMRLLVSHFEFFLRKQKMENFIFSSEISYGLSILRKQSKMNRSSWRIHGCASGSSCRIVIDDPGKKKKPENDTVGICWTDNRGRKNKNHL
jgi:hypothetical protein